MRSRVNCDSLIWNRIAVCLCATLVPQLAWGVSFEGLGDLAGGVFFSEAFSVSADGAVVVGRSTSTLNIEAFIWDESGGMQGLGDLPGSVFFSRAYSVSANGEAATGYSDSAAGRQAFLWTSSGGMQGIGDLPGGGFFSHAFAISADGGTIAGNSATENSIEVFRWTANGGMENLGNLSGANSIGTPHAVSGDGSVVVGTSTYSSGVEAFQWNAINGIQGMGFLPGGSSSEAIDITPDGSVIVGYSNSDVGTEAFYWTTESGMQRLGDLAGGAVSSKAYAVSSDGQFVVGTGTTADGEEAMIWDQTNGMRSVKKLLSDNGVDLTGWSLVTAKDISADGKTIVGWGSNPAGNSEAWLARLPPMFSVRLIEKDLVPGSGDGLITLDLDTGLEWLDVPATQGLSYNDVVADSGGWISQGFRYAIDREVLALWETASIPLGISTSFTAFAEFGALLGYTWLPSGVFPGIISGVTGTLSFEDVHAVGNIQASFDGLELGVSLGDFKQPDFVPRGDRGSWLVRPGPNAGDGDVNEDGVTNLGDFILVLRYVLGVTNLSNRQIARGDIYPAVTGDGVINLSDLVMLRQ